MSLQTKLRFVSTYRTLIAPSLNTSKYLVLVQPSNQIQDLTIPFLLAGYP
jgi:hypothetical protein